MTRRMVLVPMVVLVPVIEEHDDPPPSYDATTSGAEIDEPSSVRPLPKPALAKTAGADVVPLRRVAAR